jgi:ribosomal-protein-alanine N-acetyltransferase
LETRRSPSDEFYLESRFTVIARGSRIELRPFAARDAVALLAIFQDPAVRRYLLDDVIVSEEWVQQEIQSSDERFSRGSAGLWAIRLIRDETIIGFVGFREFFDPPQTQLLYGLLPQYWGHGFATEAATLACEHAFAVLGWSEVVAATDVPNDASIRVLERLGMRQTRATNDGPAGTVFYAVSRDEWLRRATSSPRT